MTTITIYRLTAYYMHSGMRCNCTQAEVLGEHHTARYLSPEAAEAARADAQELADAHHDGVTVEVREDEVSGDRAVEAVEAVTYASAQDALRAIRSIDRDSAVVAANWAQASCAVLVSWSHESGLASTGRQVADYRHDRTAAVEDLDPDSDVTWVMFISPVGSATVERWTA
jgi:hypothetical protein